MPEDRAPDCRKLSGSRARPSILITFQSRFGKAEWLQPYTQADPGKTRRTKKPARVDVICPGFVADCLETLEEIAMDCKEEFLACGGKRIPLHSLPSTNGPTGSLRSERPCQSSHLAGWPLAATDPTPQSKQRAARRSAPNPETGLELAPRGTLISVVYLIYREPASWLKASDRRLSALPHPQSPA
jgi:hypothetical protein